MKGENKRDLIENLISLINPGVIHIYTLRKGLMKMSEAEVYRLLKCLLDIEITIKPFDKK